MSHKQLTYTIGILIVLAAGESAARGENIDPYGDGSKYAYGENIGWINFDPGTGPGVTAGAAKLTGKAWGANIGWICLDPNDDDPDTGVRNDGAGRLSGLAWAENVGWINFKPKVPGDPNSYGVTIDDRGEFSGWAWGENIGWIHFQSKGPVPYKVQACVVRPDDLANFASDWLRSGVDVPGDLSADSKVDLVDYSTLASYWYDFCPDNWPLK